MSALVDSVSLLSSVMSANLSTAANQRQVAVAVNAVKTEQATVATLLDAIQQSASYGSGGQALSSGAVGSVLATTA